MFNGQDVPLLLLLLLYQNHSYILESRPRTCVRVRVFRRSPLPFPCQEKSGVAWRDALVSGANSSLSSTIASDDWLFPTAGIVHHPCGIFGSAATNDNNKEQELSSSNHIRAVVLAVPEHSRDHISS